MPFTGTELASLHKDACIVICAGAKFYILRMRLSCVLTDVFYIIILIIILLKIRVIKL
jgi:hypothetical protein